jgi:hypothetical protein
MHTQLTGNLGDTPIPVNHQARSLNPVLSLNPWMGDFAGTVGLTVDRDLADTPS